MYNQPKLLANITGLFFSLLFINAQAQQRDPISGIVVSQDKFEAIDGVTILWNYKGVGSITNSDGWFVIVLSPPYRQQDSLLFSCIGFVSKSISINDALKNKNLVIRLKTAVENLYEVTIRPLTVKQLLDSIVRHNYNAFVSPMTLSGYYREFAYTNSKCNEYADALAEYHFDRNAKTAAQLKISASRCLTLKGDNGNKKNAEFYNDSKIDPLMSFDYALLPEMIKKYFPDKWLANYKYTIEQSGTSADDLKITVVPANKTGYDIFQVVFMVNNDFTLRSYHVEIPVSIIPNVKEGSLLGVHQKKYKTIIDVRYTAVDGMIYPNYYTITRGYHVWGKIFGTSFDQFDDDKSEFIVTAIDRSTNISVFLKDQVYKKGNICDNGLAMNDLMLKNYTVIKPSVKDSIAIRSLSQ